MTVKDIKEQLAYFEDTDEIERFNIEKESSGNRTWLALIVRKNDKIVGSIDFVFYFINETI